jgi:hypothetical protein
MTLVEAALRYKMEFIHKNDVGERVMRLYRYYNHNSKIGPEIGITEYVLHEHRCNATYLLCRAPSRSGGTKLLDQGTCEIRVSGRVSRRKNIYKGSDAYSQLPEAYSSNI